MTIPTGVYAASAYGDGTYGQVPANRHGLDSVGVFWDPANPGQYDVLPVLRVLVQRGRTSERASVEQGRCHVEVHDPQHVYDPSNGSSPIAANLKLMRTLTVYASVDDMRPARAIFTGFVSRITHEPAVGAKRTLIEAVDAYEWLNTIRPVIASTGPVRVGAAIGLVLDAAGVPAAARSLNQGDLVPDFSADGTVSGLALVQNLLVVDRGVFVVLADGTHAYRDRAWYTGVKTASATLTSALAEAYLPARDVLNVVNKQTVRQLPSGTAQTAQNAASQTDYRVREGGRIESAYLQSDNQAASLASYVVVKQGQPDLPTREIGLPGLTTAQLAQQRDREVADLVTLSGIGSGGDCYLEGVRHEITRAQHKTSLYVTLRGTTVITIGVSTLENTHVVGY